MSDRSVDLIKKVCPFVLMSILKEIGKIKRGETVTFLVNDPLAIKSIPEEIQEYKDLVHTIIKLPEGWKIIITRVGD